MKRWWLPLAFAVSFFAVGVFLWPVPYADVELPTTLICPALLVIGVAALLARLGGTAGFFLTTLVVGASAPAAILARVMVETSRDPTSHNLWPLEIIIGGVLGLGCAGIGALPGTVLARVSRKR